MMDSFPRFPAPGAKIGLLGIAFDANSSFERGPAEAPPRIRAAMLSPSSNLWTEDGVDLGAPGLFADSGDLAPEPARMFEEVERAAMGLRDAGLRVLAFGGDHSVSYPLVSAAARGRPGLSILHFDAHPDLYDDFEGNPESHASPFARIMERGLAQRLVQVGIRTANGHQREQAARFGVETIPPERWEDALGLAFDGPVYVSFDLDCLDPAFAPGVSHLEPGGLSTRQALDLIRSIRGQVVAADVVELNPRFDVRGMGAMAAAKIAKELAASMLR